jgi:hypothetical protein
MICRRTCEHGVSLAVDCVECENKSIARPGIDCPRCGEEFDEHRCRRAKGSALCLECAVDMDRPLDPDDQDRLDERAFDRHEGNMYAGSGGESPSYRAQMIDAGRGHLLS